ncbi:hypothetical protein BDW02DRAFT_613458, partial [Decorospora gaudefroyi]
FGVSLLVWGAVGLNVSRTIVTVGDKRYIEIEREYGKERLVIGRVIKRVPCIAGRATTCWKVYQEDHPGTPLVVKDSWQYPEIRGGRAVARGDQEAGEERC